MKRIIAILLVSFSFLGNAQVADVPENIAPLLIGEKIPNVKLVGLNGKAEDTNLLFSKKTVVVVYRGGWCPYCNAQLSDMQAIESDIVGLGYQIVAISPDAPEFLKETEGKDKLAYKLFSDSEGQFSKAVGIAFSTPVKYADMLGKYSVGKNTTWLPVPTVYVVNENQEIEFLYINPDYSKRLKGDLLLSVLKSL
ncbi:MULTISPECIES: peroxiredoxin-like family protein [Flavobacterium]|uniref:thioredoxin-dependent peroxiredoxin n=1 Tax=Flavobacterium jumunjinense TaxID=998845 RepID=A0ABV5GL13_9FLAO|nr:MULTISPECIES: peroxiredoxin-like family protein [Flavobacterium]